MGEPVAAVLLIAGCALAFVAGVGVVRFPDLFARMHAATKPASLGLVLVALGAMATSPVVSDVTKLALVIGLQLLTAPVGAHVIARSAYWAGVPMSSATVLDELAADHGEDVAVPGGADEPPDPQVTG